MKEYTPFKHKDGVSGYYLADMERREEHIRSATERGEFPDEEELARTRRLIDDGNPCDFENVYKPLTATLSKMHHLEKMGIAEREWIDLTDEIAEKFLGPEETKTRTLRDMRMFSAAALQVALRRK